MKLKTVCCLHETLCNKEFSVKQVQMKRRRKKISQTCFQYIKKKKSMET